MKNNECVNVTLVCDDMKAIQINLSVEFKKPYSLVKSFMKIRNILWTDFTEREIHEKQTNRFFGR